MANIGTFTRDGDSYSGAITTLALKAKATFQPNTKANDLAPDYRVYAGGAEIGAAWMKTSRVCGFTNGIFYWKSRSPIPWCSAFATTANTV